MNIKNLQYNADNTINCVIEHPVFGWIPFTADPNDTEASGREIHQEIIEGLHGAIAAYIAPPPPPPLTNEELFAQAQANRQAAYRTEADELYFTITEEALRAGTPPDYTAWLALKDEIRGKFPYPKA